MSESKLITIKEASKMLGVTPLTLRNWDKSGKLVALRHPLNNYRVYKRADIDDLIEQISSNTAPVGLRSRRKVVKKLEIKHIRE